MDEPFADVATVPEAVLGRLAAAEGWKFAFEGEGADSAFGGSYKFLAEKYRSYARLLRIFRPLLVRTPKNRRGKIPTLALKLQMLLEYAEDPEPFSRAFSFLYSANRLPSVPPDDWDAIIEHYRYLFDLAADPLNRLAALTFWGVIPYLENRKLEVVERFSNIDLVLPFLDRSIVRSAFLMPGERKVRWGYGKYPLRREFGASLPPHARSRRKLSFVPPVADWLLETRTHALMTSTLLPREVVAALVREHRRGQCDHTPVLWALYCAEHWLSQHRSYTRPAV
jgi:asparagine synthase (glutamine-hydrolysing)